MSGWLFTPSPCARSRLCREEKCPELPPPPPRSRRNFATKGRRYSLLALAAALCALTLLFSATASAATPRELADEYCRLTNAAWCLDKDGDGTRESAPALHPLFTEEGIENLRENGAYFDPNDVYEPPPTPPTPTPTPTPTPAPTPPPTPTPLPVTLTAGGNPTATTATLTIANRSGNWHYKHTTPAGGDCSSTAQTGTTANLTGLNPNTRYIFSAYSDAGCNNRLATASAFSTDNPSLAASGVAQTATTLTISNWAAADGSWYYKANTGPHTSCSSAQSGASVSLSGLTASTSYTYAAYSDSGCTSAKKVTADLTFSTPGSPTLGASNPTATTATLTVGNHTSAWYYKADNAPHTSCSSAVSGATANVTGLSTGTTYTYTAYSDSSCATTLATASAFTTTTPSLTASNTGTTGSLTLSGWTPNKDGNWRYKAENAPYANCPSTAQSGTTAGLTGLAPNTEYTFKAYSDSGCSAEIAAASAFTVPALTASSVTATTATLTLANRSGNWWLKYTSPSGGTCTAGEADFSHALTGLSTNTRYIFRAYSDSSYNNIIATASAFTTDTPGLTAGSTATATTATLTVSNWAQADGAWYYKANRAPHASCSSEIAAGTTTASLSGLTMNASYTYTAYSDSSCSNAVATASAFTTDNPTLASSDVTATTATLTLSNWASADGAWRYKSTTPSGSCSSEVAAGTTTADLTSLATGTSHTFKAYSDSSCSTEIAAASAFTTSTPTLTVSNVGNTGATITLGGWDLTGDGSWYYKANASPDNTCSSAVTTAAETLTGLTPGDSYAYKAYSDSGCSTEIAAAGAAFVPGVTVSNLDQTLASNNYSFGGAFSKHTLRAISFTTGSNANGYTLKDITAKFADKEGNPNSIVAKVYTASGSTPSTTVVTTLSGSDPDTAGDYKYTCSTSCDLAASTTYFLVLSAPSSPTTGRNVYWWRSTASNSETLTPSGNGWSIGNLGLFSDSDNLPSWFEHDNPANSVVLRVVAVTK